MKFVDMKSMSASEIKDKCVQIKKELFNLRFQKASGDSVKPSRIRELKKDYARLLTIMNGIVK